MMIAGFTPTGVEKTIFELKVKGYILQEISVIKKIDREEIGKSELGEIITFIEPVVTGSQLQEVMSLSSVFPLLDDLLVSGPIALILKINMLNSSIEINDNTSEKLYSTEIRAVCDRNVTREQAAISAVLTDIGVSSENSFFFSQIINSGGIVLIIPERGDSDLYEILLSHGALRIDILSGDGPPVKGQL